MGSLSGRHDAGQRGEPGTISPHQTRGGAGPGPGAGQSLGVIMVWDYLSASTSEHQAKLASHNGKL